MFKQPAVIQETDIICSVFDKSLQCYPIIYFCEKVYLQTTSKSKFSYSKRVLELGSTAYYLHNFLITMSQIQISWCNYFYLLRYQNIFSRAYSGISWRHEIWDHSSIIFFLFVGKEVLPKTKKWKTQILRRNKKHYSWF